MGGGAGIGSGATVAPAPYNAADIRRSTSDIGTSTHAHHKVLNTSTHRISKSQLLEKSQRISTTPLGLVNVGNTCYANATLQCLLNSALSHVLLDPRNTHIFRQYSSNPQILAMGSGSVDEDDDKVDDLDTSMRDVEILPRIQSCPPKTSLSQEAAEREQRREIRRKMREAKRKAKQKKEAQETCRWLTNELTGITRLYTGRPYETNEGMDAWTNMMQMFSGPEDNAVDPGSITRQVNRLSPCLRPYQQEDAHEFLRSLLSTLTLDGYNKKLSSLFDGLLESAVTCQTCNNSSITRDRYMDLSLDIQGEEITDLSSALRNFTKTELLDADNKVTCSHCQQKQIVSKGLRLATAPSILVCHLKRFAFDMYGRTTRISKRIKYPQELELGAYMSRANQGKPPPYELMGVIVHTGKRCDRGHYVAYVKKGNDWYRTSDSEVTPVDLATVLRQQAYILIYEVEAMRVNHGLHCHERYHVKKSLSEDNHDSLKKRKSTASKRQETDDTDIASWMDSMINLCAPVEYLRDSICESEKKKERKKRSKSKKKSSKSSIKLEKVPSAPQAIETSIETCDSQVDSPMNDASKSLSLESSMSDQSDDMNTLKDLTALRHTLPPTPKDIFRNNSKKKEAELKTIGHAFKKSSSSNNLLEKAEEAAIEYQKERFYRDESLWKLPSESLWKHPSRSRALSDQTSPPKANVHRLLVKSSLALKDKGNKSIPRNQGVKLRQWSSAPRSGRAKSEGKRDRLPPLPTAR